LFSIKSRRDISNLIFSDSLQKLEFFEKISTKCLLHITFYHFKAFCSEILSKQKCFSEEIKLSQVFVSIIPSDLAKYLFFSKYIVSKEIKAEIGEIIFLSNFLAQRVKSQRGRNWT
jgi:hypothetical protein